MGPTLVVGRLPCHLLKSRVMSSNVERRQVLKISDGPSNANAGGFWLGGAVWRC